ncbi:hypothetical protein OAF30_02160, partial [Flavobacteriales bacterium]|nr:hypothetical protein [Flavobacteriales bacterium]
EQSRLGVVSTDHLPMVRIRFNRRFKETRDREDEIINACDFIAVKGGRALGNKLSSLPVTEVILEPKDAEREALAETKWLETIGEAPSPPVPEDTAQTKPKETISSSKAKKEDNITGADDEAAQPTLF